MASSWAFLLIAGAFEVAFATCLKLSDGLRKKTWTGLFIVAAAISFLLLRRAIETIPLGTAYAVWTGIGAAGTAARRHVRLQGAALARPHPSHRRADRRGRRPEGGVAGMSLKAMPPK